MGSSEFFLGRRSAGFAYAIEDVAYGTENTATTFAWPGYVEQFIASDEQVFADLTPMDGTDTRNVAEYFPQVPNISGTIRTKLQHGRMLAALGIGADVVTGSYTHTVDFIATLPSFSFQAGHLHSSAPFGKLYTGAMVKKWELNMPKGEFVTINYDIVAQNVVKDSTFKAYQASVDTLKKYTSAQMNNYRSSQATITINNVDISAVSSGARLSCDNNLLIESVLDKDIGDFISEPIPQIPEIEAGLTVKMKDDDLWDLWKAGATVENCSCALTRGADSITFDFTGTKISRANEPIDIGQGVVIQDLVLKIPKLTMTEVNTLETDYDTVCA